MTEREVLVELLGQLVYRNPKGGAPVCHTGGLSVLEDAFELIGLPDPCPEAEFEARLTAWVGGEV